MKASYTILNPDAAATRRWLAAVPGSGQSSWLAAMGTLAVGVPLALGFSLFLFASGDDDAGAMSGDLSPAQVAELALPDLPQDVAAAVTVPNGGVDLTLPPPAALTDTTVPETSAPQEQAAAEQADSPEEPPDDPSRRTVRLEWGDTLIGLLAKVAVPEAEAHEALSALRKVYNPREMKAGNEVTVVFDNAGVFSGFEFEPEADRAVRVERNGNGYRAATVMRPLSNDVMAAAVNIEGSLYESGIKAGIPVGAMSDLVRALSYSVDFQRDIHPGDTFRVLYEVRRNPEGVLVRTGKVLFAEISMRGKVVPVYLHRFADGREEYFDGQGRSLRRSLLRTPVNAVRISSGFGMRNHPVLGYSRMHRGVDFAAPTGTKIYASGDGVIVERGWKNGYGNYIRIRHNNTISTAYAHMSRFASGLGRGSRVRQGDVIGFVGSTGRSTGPHLHYEILVNGTQVNPLRVANLQTGEGLSGRDLTRFKDMIAAIATQFRTVETGRAVDVAYRR